ncbi:uncharacterized protein EV154DRAFT_513038 [Mucor mucedo]|uniref:uncharacterized protein n=1 Tax=Mucor mucedo TaxID=29922 RepID=UPI00221E9F88|nr:uncharacterized protein EV154DRAFT_513038 [Mucor mucedo]KAI7889836.1 hypothetical protein EV154DRAFT_513038 [Mucor mucedo]
MWEGSLRSLGGHLILWVQLTVCVPLLFWERKGGTACDRRLYPFQETEDTRLILLQRMVDNLRSRVFAQKVFVSASSKASDPLHERDLHNHFNYNKLNNVDGNIQDFLEYIYSSDKKLCMVATDFTGITTRPTNIVKLLNTNASIKKVAIETFHTSNDVWIYDSEKIITDNNLLERFNSRKIESPKAYLKMEYSKKKQHMSVYYKKLKNKKNKIIKT